MASSAGLSWTSDTLTPAMKGAKDKASFYLARTTEFYSLRAETFVKSKAPWTDRSGNARSGLSTTYTGTINADGAVFEIDVFHRVPYGIWLEVKYNGKFSIINKSLESEGPKYFAAANQVMARIFGGS